MIDALLIIQASAFILHVYFLCLQILVPPIIPSSRWSWDPEEERKRQEKWQKEQERLLQVHKDRLIWNYFIVCYNVHSAAT